MKRALRCLACATLLAPALPAAELPPWDEVIGIVRSNLAGASESELNEAAVQGLLQQLRSRVLLEPGSTVSAVAAADSPPLSRTNVFESAYAYLRIAGVVPGLAEAVQSALGSLQATQEIKGLVLDLRFAGGEDFAEAGRSADLFVNRQQTLLAWGDERVEATLKTNAVTLPVALLVNSETRAAAEALAATLHALRLGLLLGAPTAGQASVFQEFTLSTGQRLRVAVAPVQVGGDTPVPLTGLVPDLAVVVSLEEERAYLDDPFRAGAGPSRPTSRAARLTEEDLVRLHREAFDPTAPRPRRPAPAVAPQVRDPALLRALDLLKGLALVGLRQP
jgi:hypothetical protein